MTWKAKSSECLSNLLELVQIHCSRGLEGNRNKRKKTKKQFISDGARAPNNTLFVKDNNGTQTVSQLQLLLEREPLEDAENQYLPIPFCQIVCAEGRLCTYIV